MSVSRISAARRRGSVPAILLAVVSVLVCSSADAETHAIDLQRSSLTVHVFKSGLLSAFADNHVIHAPVSSGSVEEGSPPGVEVTVDARRMKVLDPELAPAKRDEVQQRMLGPEVLDVSRFPEIRFRSTAVKPLAAGRWRVEGLLALHGVSAPVSFEVTEEKGEFRGSATFAQRTFGIEPITIAAGTVKVKDEVKVDFDIATLPSAGH
ncbi:MAG: YceI family protein [Acidithiobacillales bacterium]